MARAPCPVQYSRPKTQSLHRSTSIAFHSLCVLAGRGRLPGRREGGCVCQPGPALLGPARSRGATAAARSGGGRRGPGRARPGPRRHGYSAGLLPWRRRGAARVRPGRGRGWGLPAPRGGREGWRRGRAAAGRVGPAPLRPPALGGWRGGRWRSLLFRGWCQDRTERHRHVCMFVCVHVCIYIYMNACALTYLHTYKYTPCLPHPIQGGHVTASTSGLPQPRGQGLLPSAPFHGGCHQPPRGGATRGQRHPWVVATGRGSLMAALPPRRVRPQLMAAGPNTSSRRGVAARAAGRAEPAAGASWSSPLAVVSGCIGLSLPGKSNLCC